MNLTSNLLLLCRVLPGNASSGAAEPWLQLPIAALLAFISLELSTAVAIE